MQKAILLSVVQMKSIELSKRLKEVMLDRNLTVSDLSNAAGVSMSSMEKYLAGPSSPRATAIANLCMAHELSPSWLLFGTHEHDEVAEAIQFTISVRDTLAQHLPRLSADHALLRILMEEQPGSEIRRRELNNNFAYRVAKRAHQDYAGMRAKTGVVVGKPMGISPSEEP